ncbi:hypothetical protein MKW92_013042 [Papaver armeniacum]|nr:hypothetical protein MKW92_013042 [Papaver armeniacum]
MASPNILLHFLLLFIILLCSTVQIQSRVPANETFQIINQPDEYVGLNVEYWAEYRNIYERRLRAEAFGLYFYNTTPNAFILGMGSAWTADNDLMYWVWDANRNNPVGDNATLTFGENGNLVLADVDGRIAWQTNTADKGVTGISLKSNGNLVLHDKYGRFIWQSFDYPTDTLLVGNSLKVNGKTNRLVSRTSDRDARDGPYSIVINRRGFIMYHNNSGALVQYGGWEAKGALSVKFNSIQQNHPIAATYFLTLGFGTQKQANLNCSNVAPSPQPGTAAPAPAPEEPLPPVLPRQRRVILKKVYFGDSIIPGQAYNFKHSFIRLGSDGTLRLDTLYLYTGNMFFWVEEASFRDTVKECAY